MIVIPHFNMKRIRSFYCYKYFASIFHKFLVKRDPRKEMRRVYYKVYHQYPDFENPQNLIEKIYWMQLYSDTSLWTKCADKYAMREYVKECGLEEYLPENYGKWDKVNNIDFNTLPNEFVLKTNNGCGTVLIVRDKSTLDIKTTKKMLQQWLNVPFGWSGAELHYTRIVPCIIAEELLKQDKEQLLFSPNSQVDYKVWCINGELESILVVYDRDKDGYCLDLYDTEWRRIKDKLKKNGHFKMRDAEVPKPICLDLMLEMAQKLAKPFPEVRVDFYIVNGEPVIGELTFTTGYGYFSDDYYHYLGKKINLDRIPRKQ